jgi:hypothetical protein
MDRTTHGQWPAPSLPSRIVGREYAERAAKTIFARYPNPKAGPEYLVELVNCLADQPQWIVDRLADRHLGITAKHRSFVPGIGDVLDMVASLNEMEERYTRYGDAQKRFLLRSTPVLQPFRPFPKLWDVFADEPAVIKLLDHPGSFDFLNVASRTLATQGKEAARTFILSTDGNKPVDTRATSEAAA